MCARYYHADVKMEKSRRIVENTCCPADMRIYVYMSSILENFIFNTTLDYYTFMYS